MLEIMVDIETLSTRTQAVIIQIGAVAFDRKSGEIPDEMLVNVNMNSCLKLGLEVDGKTLLWWMDQPKEARDAVFKNPEPLPKALGLLNSFIDKHKEPFVTEEGENRTRSPKMWSHSTFDYNRLEAAYEACDMRFNIRYQKARDIRTLTDLAEMNYDEIKDQGFEGQQHTALADCRNQVKYMTKCFNRLKVDHHDIVPGNKSVLED